ncbi:MAG: DUF4239 domain-containing protein [Verrucomicrobia bacterium]|nr:DUF4239 domain-containing protein [Verrucomicrobiota bacterium]MBS0636341.1 DUF4239 domain-containing protein [Verrucomicrobiota bacterium]
MFIFDHLAKVLWDQETLLFTLVFILFAVAGIFLVRKLANHNILKGHRDVAGFVFTNLGVLYAVLLGFTVVNAQQRYDKLKDVTQVEASYLAELYRDAEVFSVHDKEAVRSAIKNYCHSVVNEEWDLMTIKKTSPNTVSAIENIWKTYYAIDLSTKKQEVWYAESISKLNELVSVRLSRLLGSQESLSSQMWAFLIVGGFVLVAFVWFFGFENLTFHIFMISILATSTALLLVLIYSLDTAFVGEDSIQPEAISNVLHSFVSVSS